MDKRDLFFFCPRPLISRHHIEHSIKLSQIRLVSNKTLPFNTVAFLKIYTQDFYNNKQQQQQRLIPLGGVGYMDQLPP